MDLAYMQMKNMINALYSSQRGGSKSEMDGINFGWSAIIDMYKREIERSTKFGCCKDNTSLEEIVCLA